MVRTTWRNWMVVVVTPRRDRCWVCVRAACWRVCPWNIAGSGSRRVAQPGIYRMSRNSVDGSAMTETAVTCVGTSEPRSTGRVVGLPRRQRSERLNGVAADHHWCADNVHGICSRCARNAIDRNDRVGLVETTVVDRFAGRLNWTSMGTMRWLISCRPVRYVPTPSTPAPPGVAVAGRPSPAEAVIVIPITSGVGEVAPLFTRHPDVAELRRPDPVATSVGVPVA
jgi:hypothetical protein